MCVELTYTHHCGHKSFEDWPCQQFGTPDYLFCYISQREENAASSCDKCEENFRTLTDRSEVYLSACQRSLVPLLQRMQFISDNRHVINLTDTAYDSLSGERDVVETTLWRAETRATQTPLLMALRAEFLFDIHRVSDAQPWRMEYERELQDVERQLASFHDQLSTETQPDTYIAEMLTVCDVDTIFHKISRVIDTFVGSGGR